MQLKFTVRVRLILFCDSKVLVAHHHPTNTYFMPGGGLEHGESSINCLRREIAEESDLQLPSEITPFGILENRFVENEKDVHEVLIHFKGHLQGKQAPKVNSRESDLAFEWLPVSTFTQTKILPPETYNAVVAAQSGGSLFYYAPL